MFLGKFIFVAILCKMISSKMQEFGLDVNDLLDDNLMPMSFMLLQNSNNSNLKNGSQQTLDDEFKCFTKEKISGEDGTFNKALSSMGFHRSMITNYLCSKFIADQIIDEIQPKKMKRRLGIAKSSPESEFMVNNSLTFDGEGRKTHMLFDEGSNDYKNWLAKTTTLNDIHRNFEMSRKLNDEKKLRRQDQFIDDTLDYKEYEGGDVTGYMEEKPLTNGGTNSFDKFSQPPPTAGSKTGKFLVDTGKSLSRNTLQDLQTLSSGYQYGPPSGPQEHSFSYHQPMPYYPPPTAMKSIGIKDLFDIALTALAFLSFGMFIIQVIMCITMAKSYDNSVMLPMEMTADGGEVEAAEIEVRVKRSIDKFTRQNAQLKVSKVTMKQINNISKRTLQSIEAFVVARHDRGRCLSRFICENNKFSRRAFDIQKFTIPIFGISLSYLSNKLNDFPIAANLENLQASLIGLGNGNCLIYKCHSDTINKRK